MTTQNETTTEPSNTATPTRPSWWPYFQAMLFSIRELAVQGHGPMGPQPPNELEENLLARIHDMLGRALRTADWDLPVFLKAFDDAKISVLYKNDGLHDLLNIGVPQRSVVSVPFWENPAVSPGYIDVTAPTRGDSLNGESILSILTARLNHNTRERFVVGAGAAMVLHGLKPTTADIDLFAVNGDEDIAAAMQSGAWRQSGALWVRNDEGRIELGFWRPLTRDDYVDVGNAQSGPMLVMRPTTLEEWYERAVAVYGRPKDSEHLACVQKMLSRVRPVTYQCTSHAVLGFGEPGVITWQIALDDAETLDYAERLQLVGDTAAQFKFKGAGAVLPAAFDAIQRSVCLSVRNQGSWVTDINAIEGERLMVRARSRNPNFGPKEVHSNFDVYIRKAENAI